MIGRRLAGLGGGAPWLAQMLRPAPAARVCARKTVTPGSRFDRGIDALNRLPRPLLAIGTLALFLYAIIEPAGFTLRMQALGHVPEPLWWLIGGVVTFYFGAREAHHLRCARSDPAPDVSPTPKTVAETNPALAEWKSAGRAQDP